MEQIVDLLAPMIEATIENGQDEQATWQREHDAEKEDLAWREELYWADYHTARSAA